MRRVAVASMTVGGFCGNVSPFFGVVFYDLNLVANDWREPMTTAARRERGERPKQINPLDVSRARGLLEREDMSGVSLPLDSPGERLLGRAREREVLDRLLAGVRAGHAGVLVMEGEAGVGKTVLLGYTVAAASRFRVARTFGVEAE